MIKNKTTAVEGTGTGQFRSLYKNGFKMSKIGLVLGLWILRHFATRFRKLKCLKGSWTDYWQSDTMIPLTIPTPRAYRKAGDRMQWMGLLCPCICGRKYKKEHLSTTDNSQYNETARIASDEDVYFPGIRGSFFTTCYSKHWELSNHTIHV